MKIEYKLEYLDYLTYQLYSSSKSAIHQKRRRNSRISIPVIYILFALFTLSQSGFTSLVTVLFLLAILWYLFYPKYASWKYKRHFEQHVRDNYEKKTESVTHLDFQDDAIQARDVNSESTIQYSSIEKLIELPNHFLLRLKSGDTLIIPRQSVKDLDDFKSMLESCGVKNKNESDWEWS